MDFERIIVVDDDPIIRRMLTSHLQKRGVPVLGVATAQQALQEQTNEPADLLIVDVQLPDGSGMDLLEEFRKLSTPADVIIMTGFGTIESAVQAMKLGAANYLLKPFSLTQFDLALDQLLSQRKLRVENTYLREQLADDEGPGFLRTSPEMDAIQKLIDRVAPTNATVLIQGESGTGKEVIARALHQQSLRRDKPYIKVNCAAIPDHLLESEFFGHEKGAFTGASSRRAGRFEMAHGGTLLLDEVTEISLALQSKLLRVLQEQEFERVGGGRTIHVDVRVLATTNRDLTEAIEGGIFRRDLYFRLNVVPIHIPPLRERPREIEYLLNCFLERFAQLYGKPLPTLSPIALQQLNAYPWPGNVRELQNFAERAMILSEPGRVIEFSDIIPAPPNETESVLDDREGFPTVAAMEERLIELALKRTNGNRNEAAKLLDITPRTLRNKLKEYEAEPESAPAA